VSHWTTTPFVAWTRRLPDCFSLTFRRTVLPRFRNQRCRNNDTMFGPLARRRGSGEALCRAPFDSNPQWRWSAVRSIVGSVRRRRPERYQRTSRTSRPAGAHRGHQHLRYLRRAIRPARPGLTLQDSTQRSTTAGEQVITTDTQVLRRDGLDVVALPQTWGPAAAVPARAATDRDRARRLREGRTLT
jgi:hypothetical protein